MMNFECPHCGWALPTPWNYAHHMVETHPDTEEGRRWMRENFPSPLLTWENVLPLLQKVGGYVRTNERRRDQHTFGRKRTASEYECHFTERKLNMYERTFAGWCVFRRKRTGRIVALRNTLSGTKYEAMAKWCHPDKRWKLRPPGIDVRPVYTE